MKKKIAATILCFALLFAGTGWAEGSLKSIEVLFERIHVSVNGQQAELSKDSIFYNGSIYVPLRSLSEMLGAEVSWNDEARTVNLDFIVNQAATLQSASQQGIYQYIALQNNSSMLLLKEALLNNDTNRMGQVRERYKELETLASTLKNDALSQSFAKLAAAVELLRGGWSAKNLDDYSIAWNIFSANAEKVNTLLKAQLSAGASAGTGAAAGGN